MALGIVRPSTSQEVSKEHRTRIAWNSTHARQWLTVGGAVTALATAATYWALHKRDDVMATLWAFLAFAGLTGVAVAAEYFVRWLQAPGVVLAERLQAARQVNEILERRVADFEKRPDIAYMFACDFLKEVIDFNSEDSPSVYDPSAHGDWIWRRSDLMERIRLQMLPHIHPHDALKIDRALQADFRGNGKMLNVDSELQALASRHVPMALPDPPIGPIV